MVTKKTLVLTFGLANGNTLNLTINKPNDSLTGAQVKAAMDQIVASNGYGDDSLATSAVSAQYVTQETQEIALV